MAETTQVGLSPEMATELANEYSAIKETLDSQSGKRSEAKQEIVNSVVNQDKSNSILKDVLTVMEAHVGEGTANWINVENALKVISEVVSNNADAYIDSEMSARFKTISGDSETLRARAKAIKERYEILGDALKQFGGIEIPELPKLTSGGRPSGSGKHQTALKNYRVTFWVNEKAQSATRLSTVLLSASAKCGGSGDNGSLKVKEFLEILKAEFPTLANEYDGNWSVKLTNGNTLAVTREEVSNNGGGDSSES